MRLRAPLAVACAALSVTATADGRSQPSPRSQPVAGPLAVPRSRIRGFIVDHCTSCHEGSDAKAGLDLARLGMDFDDPRTFAKWVKIYDRVSRGEMPPAKRDRPPRTQTNGFLSALGDPLVAADLVREGIEGRATRRRLNRYEYENTLRELFGAPWLQVKATLPDDGEAHRFNKVGEALDVSHVHLAQYLAAAEGAIKAVLAASLQKPEPKLVRYHTRDMRSFAGPMKFSEFNRSPERATFPVLGFSGQPLVRSGAQPMTVGPADSATREQEAMGVVASAYEPLEPKFNDFRAPRSGRYRVSLNAHAVWVGPNKTRSKWWSPDLDTVSRGRRPEPITLYAETPPRQLRRLGAFDAGVEPTVGTFEVYLLEGETIRPDAARLFRSRPPNFHNPLATKEGQPGVAYRWLEVEGPLVDVWPTVGRQLLFGDLPIEGVKATLRVVSQDPRGDARRLLRGFLDKAYREPATEADFQRFIGLIDRALDAGVAFVDAMIAGYQAVLASPRFVYLEEAPGPLSPRVLAVRLSYFLWNSPPDAALMALAERGELLRPEVLRAQTLRLLADVRARRFADAFLDYWLDLRKLDATGPDPVLYPDYYLDDLLTESAAAETQAFFAELLREDLPARHVVASDFVMINERLANHYGLAALAPGKAIAAGKTLALSKTLAPGTTALQPLGVDLVKVLLPLGHMRGGVLTQASVLKVTANGTTTSPVSRGVWISERILGRTVPPPPAGVAAVEPDIRGARTIREQLDKHRADKTCAVCHNQIDPAGFALESFDVLGGFRDRYRAVGEGGKPPEGFGKNGQPFEFHAAQPVDCTGQLPTGTKFKNVVELKEALLRDERQIARNLVQQLTVFATGAPARFGDRARVEEILDRAARAPAGRYGVKTLIVELVQSQLFRNK